ncbi:MAG: VIT1/CCC1 transporter family protein [Sciscionella sp.]
MTEVKRALHGPDSAPQGWRHRHRDVSGGWLRPTVFGAVDGLVTNAAIIAGVGGAGIDPHAIVLTGLAGLAAGAFSMGTGEYISVTNQNELVGAEVAKEAHMHALFPREERAELIQRFLGYGADGETATRMADAVSQDPEQALLVHTREELGVDPHDLPAPLVAGAASFVAFSLGALLPLLPYLVGVSTLLVSLIVTAVALTVGGMVVGRLTGRPLLRSGARQLLLGAASVAVTFGIGALIGG